MVYGFGVGATMTDWFDGFGSFMYLLVELYNLWLFIASE